MTFDLPGHLVIAGPNNAGKTTLLQAIAAWDLTFRTWKQLNNFQRRGGAYPYPPIARQAFSAVPLRQFDLLWNERNTGVPIEITVDLESGVSLAVEIWHDTTEQIKVHPKASVEPNISKACPLTLSSLSDLPVGTGC